MNKTILAFLALCLIFQNCRQNPEEMEKYPKVLKDFIKDPTKAILTDFSYAGYNHGMELPPVRKDLPVFSVIDYGAVPNDGKDDIDAAQKAIDAAGDAGGGLVYFPSGTYDFDVNTEKRFLHIKHSNVIVRGNGSELSGTIFHDHAASSHPNPKTMWLAGQWPSFIYAGVLPSDSAWEVNENTSSIVAALKPAARHSKILIADEISDKLMEGKTYLLTLEDPDSTLVYELIYPSKKIAKNHLSAETNKYKFQTLVDVVEIDNNKIHLAAPILWDLKEKYQPKLWEIPEMLEGVGVEAIRMKTDWSEPFIHHLNSIHDNGWDHIKFKLVKNSWVRNVVHDCATTAISLQHSKNCVVMDCQIIGNPGHNGFGLNGFSTHNLYINLSGGKAMHTYTIQGFSSGNVYHNCAMEEPSSIDSHGGLGVYNLFDCMYGGVFKNGGSNSNIPPAMGSKLVFWNWEMGLTDPYHGRMKPVMADYELMPGVVAVGVKGERGQDIFFKDNNGELIENDINNDWCIIECLNKKVNPTSLYRFQKKQRLESQNK